MNCLMIVFRIRIFWRLLRPTVPGLVVIGFHDRHYVSVGVGEDANKLAVKPLPNLRLPVMDQLNSVKKGAEKARDDVSETRRDLFFHIFQEPARLQPP